MLAVEVVVIRGEDERWIAEKMTLLMVIEAAVAVMKEEEREFDPSIHSNLIRHRIVLLSVMSNGDGSADTFFVVLSSPSTAVGPAMASIFLTVRVADSG